METIVYSFNKPNEPLEPSELKIEIDNKPAPKLIKYGFNNITEELNLTELRSNSYYRVGLNFDFERKDNLSLRERAQKELGAKNFNQTFAEFWEILTMFKILEKNQHILTTNKKEMENIIDLYRKMSNSKNKWTFVNDNSNSKNVTLIMQKYFDIDIDENAVIQFMLNDLPKLIQIQAKDGTMILQLSSTQTHPMAELIYYLSSLYNETYFVKPRTISNLSDSKYLLLIGFLGSKKFNIKTNPNAYIHSFGLKYLPMDFTTVIQCYNSRIIPEIYQTYREIKVYLDTKVYEGATYQDFLNKQNENINNWLSAYGNFDNIENIVNNAVEKSSEICAVYHQLNDIL